MAEAKRFSLYKNIIGDAKATIEAIQRFIEDNSPNKQNKQEEEPQPAISIKKILESIADEDTSAEVQKIIDSL